jgi:hypothetical protein
VHAVAVHPAVVVAPAVVVVVASLVVAAQQALLSASPQAAPAQLVELAAEMSAPDVHHVALAPSLVLHNALAWQHVVLSAPSNLSLTSAHVAVAHFLLAMLVWSTNPVGHLLNGHFAWQHVVLSAPSNFSLARTHVAVAQFLLAMLVWSTNPVGHLLAGHFALHTPVAAKVPSA